MQAAQKIIQRLVGVEKELVVQHKEGPSRLAVLWKLRCMRNENNSDKISTVIELLKRDANVLNLMAEAEFIADALQEYANLHSQMVDAIKKCIFRLCVNRISQHVSNLDR
jgi:predicted translin family RNA/ssDNA-binding protein